MGPDDSEAMVEEQFPVGDSPELSLGTVSGRVSIGLSSEPILRVRARKYGRPQAVENTRIEFSREGDVVTVRTKSVSRGILRGNPLCAVEFDVSVPRGCRVGVDAVSADVDLQGIGGSVDVHTVSGRVSVDTASESISITTVSGDITGHGLQGILRLTTVSGNARLTDSSLTGFEVESVSGRVQLEIDLSSTGPYRASTVSGGLKLHLPEDARATVHLSSVSGRINSELPASIDQLGFGRWQATINAGGTDLHLNSVSGNVTIAPLGVPVAV
jgi:hypothetical protein